jgi:hypothetical protein
LTDTTVVPRQQWLSIRCGDCSKLVYRERVGSGLLSVKRRGCGVISIGVPVLVYCDCGWFWQNPDVTYVLDDMTEELPAPKTA